MYNYKAIVKRVISGDSFEAEVDLGFKIKVTETFRLAHITAPSIRGEEREEGLKSKEFFQEVIDKHGVGDINEHGVELMITSIGTDQYGRYLAEIEIVGEVKDDSINVNEYMLESNQAVKYEG